MSLCAGKMYQQYFCKPCSGYAPPASAAAAPAGEQHTLSHLRSRPHQSRCCAGLQRVMSSRQVPSWRGPALPAPAPRQIIQRIICTAGDSNHSKTPHPLPGLLHAIALPIVQTLGALLLFAQDPGADLAQADGARRGHAGRLCARHASKDKPDEASCRASIAWQLPKAHIARVQERQQ